MTLQALAAALLLATTGTLALAQNFDLEVTPQPDVSVQNSWNAEIDAVHTGYSGRFTDIFRFGTLPVDVIVDGNLSTISFSTASNIDLLRAEASNGVVYAAFSFTPAVPVALGTESGVMNSDPVVFAAGLPIMLTVHGLTGAAASYSGNVNFALAPVPEPPTVAMWLAGLGVVGWLARRRAA